MLTDAGTWSEVARGVRVRESRAYRMNTVLLLASRQAVLVDPGVLPSELEDLAAVVREAKPRKLTLLFTHGHWDHVLGRGWWPDAATVGHARLATELQREAPRIAREAEAMAQKAGESWPQPFQPFEPDLPVSAGQTARLGPWTVTFREGAGHCDTQIAVHVASRKLLIGADMLSDIEIPILDGPVPVYRRTLESLRPLVDAGEVERLIPGHGSVARTVQEVRERLERDLAYLEELEFRTRAARVANVTLARAQEQLAAMEYTGKHAEYSMVETHRNNVRHAWEGIEAEAGA